VQPLLRPSHDYGVIITLITHVRDADSYLGIIDHGFLLFKGNFDINDTKNKVDFRQYGYNAQEITQSKSKGRGPAEVAVGYDHRDAFLTSIDVDPMTIPRKSKFNPIPWREVVVQSIWDDEFEKFGRVKAITHHKGVNTNEFMRDIIGGVEFYDGKTYPADYPIRPPI